MVVESALTDPVVLRVQTESGVAVSGVTVTGEAGSGSLLNGASSASVVSGNDGQVTFTWSMPSNPGSVVASFYADTTGTDVTAELSATAITQPPIFEQVDNLVPGEEAVLTGQFLTDVTTLTVDGVEVAVTSGSDTEVRFQVPVTRTCEIDGRPILIASDTTTLSAPVIAPDAPQLDIGGSFLIDESNSDCIALKVDQDYLITLISGDSLPDESSYGTLSSYTAGVTSSLASVAAPVGMPNPVGPDYMMANESDFWPERTMPSTGAESSNPYSDNPVPFDPAYATAVVGDHVTLVDWFGQDAHCNSSRSSVPTFEAEVIGLSGDQLIVVDTRISNLGDYTSQSALERFDRIATNLDKAFLPAARLTYDPDFQPLHGAGGRRMIILRDLSFRSVTGLSLPPEAAPQSMCPLGSEMLAGMINSEYTSMTEGHFIGVGLHELGHAVQYVTWIRLRADGQNAYTPNWLSEGFAQAIFESGGRILKGQMTHATQDFRNNSLPQYPRALGPAYYSATNSPWADGKYYLGAQVVMYLRELLNAHVSNPSPSPFVQLALNQPWPPTPLGNVQALADLTGLELVDLVEKSHLAFILEGILDDGTRLEHGLPLLESWDPDPMFSDTWTSYTHGHDRWPDRIVSRTQDEAFDFLIQGGAYEWLHVPADAEIGVSLQYTSNSSAPDYRLRVIRVR